MCAKPGERCECLVFLRLIREYPPTTDWPAQRDVADLLASFEFDAVDITAMLSELLLELSYATNLQISSWRSAVLGI
jgi:hypothetical protein